MQEHPVPQNVTSFEFKLIGDMTLRQFGYVAGGLIIALIAFFIPDKRLPILAVYFIKYPLIPTAIAVGFALAFVPVEGRPLDKWLVSFMRAVFGNTMYIWRKEGNDLSVLNDIHLKVQAQASAALPQVIPQRRISPLDALERQSLARTGAFRPNPAASVVHQQPYQHAQQLGQRPPQMTTFAGPPRPQQSIPAPINRPQPAQPIPSIMREPHQKPLAPRRIPLPAYQQATIQQHLAQTQQPNNFGHILPIGQTQVIPASVRPQMLTANPIPTNTQRVQGPASSQTSTVLQLIQQNHMLMQRMKQLESYVNPTITHKIAPLAEENKRLEGQNQKLTSQLTWLESTLASLQKNVTALAQEDQKYQQALNQLTEKLEHTSEEKDQAVQTVEQLQKAQVSHSDLLETSQTEKHEIAERLSTMQQELENTKKIYDQLQQQKHLLEQEIQNKTIMAHEERQAEKDEAVKKQEWLPVSPHTSQDIPPSKPVIDTIMPPATQATVQDIVMQPAQPLQTNLPTLTSIPNAVCGYIFDGTGKPIPDVVIVVKKAGGPTMRALKTNRVGQFTMVSPLPDGPYEVLFEKDGYSFSKSSITAKGELILPIQVQGKIVS